MRTWFQIAAGETDGSQVETEGVARGDEKDSAG